MSHVIVFASIFVNFMIGSDDTISLIIYHYFIPSSHVFIKIPILIYTIKLDQPVTTKYQFFYPSTEYKLII